MRLPIPFHWTIRTWIATRPALFYGLYRRIGPHADLLVCAETEIVFDGFPRSGNSFALFAFEAAQGRAVRAAHHLHAPCQIMRAATLGKPACLVIREPGRAVAAALRKIPRFRAADLLLAYRLHYAALWPYRERFVVAPLETMIADYGGVIARINQRFGTQFARLDKARQDALTPAYLADERRHSAALAASGRFGVADPRRAAEAEIAAHPRLLAACEEEYRRYRALA